MRNWAILTGACSMLDASGFAVWSPLIFGGILWGCALSAGEASVYLRSWIPSWRFFENPGHSPLLEFLIEDGVGVPGWTEVPNPGRVRRQRLLFSPASNSFHAFETLVLDFALNLTHSDLEQCLMEEGVRRVLKIHPKVARIRFRLSWVDLTGGASGPVWESVWNSPQS
jgi:hypothetical protein